MLLKSNLDRQPPDGHAENFRIQLKGHLGPAWSERFGGLKITNTQSGETILEGPIADQAQLHGILASIRDLNLTLISVTRIESEDSAANDQFSDVQ